MNIKKKLYSIKNALSPDEVFLSKDYLNYLHEILKVVTRKYHQNIDINLINADKNTSASTNGSTIIIYYNAVAIATPESIYEKNCAIIGTLLHEAGHILYSDFALAEKSMRKLIEEKTFMPMPDINDNTVTMYDWIAQNGVPNELSMLYKLFDNVIEDGNIDWRIMADVPGYGVCRKKLLKWYGDTCPSYDELNKQPMKSIVLCNMILAYAKYGIILSSDTSDGLVQKFFELKVLIDDACKETVSYERKRLINNLFASFFSIFIKDMEDHENEEKNSDTSQTGDSSEQPSENQPSPDGSSNNLPDNSGGNSENTPSGDSNSNPNSNSENSQNNPNTSDANNGSSQASSSAPSQISSEKLQSAMQNLLSSLPEALTKQEDHTGNSSPKGDGTIQFPISTEDSSKTPDKDIADMMEQLAYQKLSADIESNISSDVREICMDIEHDIDIHKGIPIDVKRAKPDYNVYESEVKELRNIVRRLSKNFKKDMVERQLGDTENGLYFGKRLCTNQLYREDKKIFEKKSLPDDIPDMEVVLLVDLSGSMGGDRIETARKAASILYEFCKQLNIRVSVYGHHVLSSGFTIDVFADADSIDDKDAHRICSMNARGCNRDGLAVRYCMEKLVRSSSAVKLLTVISDGRPSDGTYDMSKGKADIQDALTKYGKQGIKTITAAIGEDIEGIKTIYTHRYADVLDISVLERLPSLFPKLIKKML